jgi:hypothetical protein
LETFSLFLTRMKEKASHRLDGSPFPADDATYVSFTYSHLITDRSAISGLKDLDSIGIPYEGLDDSFNGLLHFSPTDPKI